MIPLCDFKEKIDLILYSDEPEKEYLINDINRFYEKIKKIRFSAQVIICDFKEKKILACFEYLTDKILGKNF